jgi:hypothetical protein
MCIIDIEIGNRECYGIMIIIYEKTTSCANTPSLFAKCPHSHTRSQSLKCFCLCHTYLYSQNTSSSCRDCRRNNCLLFVRHSLRMFWDIKLLRLWIEIKRPVYHRRSPWPRAHVFWTFGICEHGLNFFQRFPSCLGKHEEDVDEHCSTEYTEENVDLLFVSEDSKRR